MKLNLPIGRKLFLSHLLIVLLVGGTVGGYFYISAAESLKASVQSRLSSSAALLSQILDATKLEEIRGEGDQALPIYQEYLELLRTFRRANPDIAYMYVMRRTGDRVTFVIDSDETEAQALPGREYLTSVPALMEGFFHPSVDNDAVTDEWGTTLSGYAPIKEGEGRYLIGIDMDAKEVGNKFQKLHLSGLISLIFGLFLAVLLSRFLASRLTTPIMVMISRCKAIAEGNFDDQLEHQNRDELGDLTNAINNMSTSLAESREQRRQAEEALKGANDDLEARINERTKDLLELNDRLRHEVDMRNITMDALGASEVRYRELADLLPQPVFESDPEGNLTFFNHAAFDVFGYALTDFKKGLKLSEIFAAEVGTRVPHEASLRYAGEKLDCAEHTARRKDGSTFPACTFVSPIMTGETIEGLRGIIIDMSEHKRMEEELLRAQKLESTSILLAGIAHDFNNLLMAILGSISLARSLISAEEKLDKLLIGAEKASLQARNLTRQLVSLSTGKALAKSIFSIRDTIHDAVELALSGSNVKCSFQIDDHLRPVLCNPGQIHQMVVNLVLNSKEAMPEGGNIEIEATNIELKPFEIPSLKAGEYVKLTIRDHGVGIPEENLPRVFDPYFSTKPRGAQKGMGLGLTVAYAIVKRHEGRLSMRSDPKVGTEVDVYLPASEGKLDEAKICPEVGDYSRRGKVLFMEDDEMVRNVAGQLLDHLGYEVHLARDGAEAIELFLQARGEELPFDLVVLDLIVRGGMGGKETIRALHQIDPAVKAIATSGYVDDPAMANFAEYGFRGAIAKPFQIEEVSEVLQRVCRGDRPVAPTDFNRP